MFEVVYYSLCGNAKNVCQTTKGLAEVIALDLGVRAEDITVKKDLLMMLLFFWVVVAMVTNLGVNYRSLLPKMILKEGRWHYLGLR